MPREDGGEEEPARAPARPLGPVWRRTYAPSPKHGPEDRGRVAQEPRDGQEALDYSIPVKPSSAVRVAIDPELQEFVVLRYQEFGFHPDQPNDLVFHGYAVSWKQLSQEMKNALIRAGMVDRRGRIL